MKINRRTAARQKPKVTKTIGVRIDEDLRNSLENEYKNTEGCTSLSAYIRFILVHRKRRILEEVDTSKRDQIIENVGHIKNMLIAESFLERRRQENNRNIDNALKYCDEILNSFEEDER